MSLQRMARGWPIAAAGGAICAVSCSFLAGLVATSAAGPPAFPPASAAVPLKFSTSGPGGGALITVTRNGDATVAVNGRRRTVPLSASRLRRVRDRIFGMPADELRLGFRISRNRQVNRLAIFVHGQSHEISAFPRSALGRDADKRYPIVDRRIARAFRFLRVLAHRLTRRSALAG